MQPQQCQLNANSNLLLMLCNSGSITLQTNHEIAAIIPNLYCRRQHSHECWEDVVDERPQTASAAQASHCALQVSLLATLRAIAQGCCGWRDPMTASNHE